MNAKLKSNNEKNALHYSIQQENEVVFPIKNCIVYGHGSAMSYVAKQISNRIKGGNK